MSKILLIHGTTVGLGYSIFKQKDLKYCFFTGVKGLIDEKKVDVYCWATRLGHVRFWELGKVMKTYFLEQEDIKNGDLTFKLFEYIQKEQIEVIILHSLGGVLLNETINKYGLPKSVKFIHSLVSDAPRTQPILSTEVSDRLNSGDLKWKNYHCFWDQSLWTSVILNAEFPSGLFGSKSHPKIQNIFCPLRGSLDFHTSIISKPYLLEKLCRQHLT